MRRAQTEDEGRKTAVVIDLAAYEALMEHLEDLEDALQLDEAARSAKSFRSYDEICPGRQPRLKGHCSAFSSCSSSCRFLRPLPST